MATNIPSSIVLTSRMLNDLDYENLSAISSVLTDTNRNLNNELRFLLTGRTKASRDQLEQQGITIPCHGYFVAVFHILSLPESLPPALEKTAQKEQQDNIYIVQRTLRTMLRQYSALRKFYVCCCFFSGTITAIFSAPPLPNPEAEAAGILRGAIRFVQDNLDAKIITGLSTYIRDASRLPEAYKQAMNHLNISKVMGEQQSLSLSVEDTASSNRLKNTFLFQTQYLSNLLLTEKYSEVPKQVEGTLRRYIQHSKAGYPILQSRLDIVKGLLVECVRSGAVMEEHQAQAEQLMAASSIHELNELTYQIFMQIADAQETAYADPLTIATAYIADHFMEYTLGVDTLCEAVQVSKPHLSRLFKARLDTTIANYINRMRITKAVELMRQSDESISSISRQVGFVNDHTFARNFQKVEGILPSEFRKLNRR